MSKTCKSKKDKGSSSGQEVDPSQVPNYGLEQFRGEGPIFWIRQFAGVTIVLCGSLILASGYTVDYWYLPFPPEYAGLIALGTIIVGALLHEIRPFKRLEMIRSLVDEQKKEAERKKGD